MPLISGNDTNAPKIFNHSLSGGYYINTYECELEVFETHVVSNLQLDAFFLRKCYTIYLLSNLFHTKNSAERDNNSTPSSLQQTLYTTMNVKLSTSVFLQYSEYSHCLLSDIRDFEHIKKGNYDDNFVKNLTSIRCCLIIIF